MKPEDVIISPLCCLQKSRGVLVKFFLSPRTRSALLFSSCLGSSKMAEIELKTAPADFRFPTANQTRHCFTRYIEYHKCVAAKSGETADCERFAKYYRSLCPTEWIEKWEEQRANGTFPGPL